MRDITDFIKLQNTGLSIASFVEIREALINRYKDAYGSDIDLSTGNADGIFVNDLALIINNILQSIQTLYSNLDVNQATGVYLDNICELSNIRRKQATQSVASVTLTNIGNSTTSSMNGIELIDVYGSLWKYDKEIPELNPNDSIAINVTCEEFGPVEAKAGSIIATVELLSLKVEQTEDAIVGENIETDSLLRERRAQSNGANGTTTLEALLGDLLTTSGIRDAYIYNNNSSESVTLNDGAIISSHSIYPIIRLNQTLILNNTTQELFNEEIGNLIYNKLTPGINTSNVTQTIQAGEIKSYEYIPTFKNDKITLFTNMIYWKQCRPVKPQIVINLTEGNYFDKNTEPQIIVDNLIKYLNNLHIGANLDKTSIMLEVADADPRFLGKSTYIVTNASISNQNTYTNPLSYYNYGNTKNVDWSYNNGVLTLIGA